MSKTEEEIRLRIEILENRYVKDEAVKVELETLKWVVDGEGD